MNSHTERVKLDNAHNELQAMLTMQSVSSKWNKKVEEDNEWVQATGGV